MKTKDKAILKGFDADGHPVFEHIVDLDEYWDESHQVIDDDAFRERAGIRTLKGTLLGNKGQVLQRFENTYDAAGRLVESVARHEDGTVVRFPN